MVIPTNEEIAEMMEQIADLLEVQKANPHRVRAYRNGAREVRHQKRSLAEMVRSGDGEALEGLPAIGESLARLIGEFVRTGRSTLLQRLQGEVAPEDLFEQIPGIGEELSERIVHQLDIRTLEELEQAAHDGRLAKVEGFGPGRIEAIKVSLAGMLSGFARRRQVRRLGGSAQEDDRPGVDLLLEVDEEYRQKAKAGELRKIAPKRFNPSNEAWLPILHEEKGGWEFTVLFSNTARAHELDKTNDWVVIYFNSNGHEDQATVVTQTGGPMDGKRVVRGREKECRSYYFG